MVTARLKRLNEELRGYDSKLFVQETRLGRYDVYRKSSLGCNPPHFIFSLTDNWTLNGRPVDWGIDVVLNRVKACDLWRDWNVGDETIQANEKESESRERQLKNSVESFLSEFRGQFAKATDGINTSTVEKLYRKEDGNGYCKPRL